MFAFGNFAANQIAGAGDAANAAIFGKIVHGMAFFALIISLINVPQIIANILLIKGKLNSSILPGVLTMLGLGIGIIGIFCCVAIFTGKFEDEVEKSQDENFIHRNFNVPSWESKTTNETVVNAEVKSETSNNDELAAMKQKIQDLEEKITEQKDKK